MAEPGYTGFSHRTMSTTRRRARRTGFPAAVSARGTLQMLPESRLRFEQHLATLCGKHVEVFVDEESHARSLQANRYYWGVVLTTMEESNIGYTKEEFHELMLAKFSTRKHYEIANPRTGEVVEEYDIIERSSTLTGRNFYRFVELVRQFLAEFYGVVTDDPDPTYWEKKHAA